jgi:RNase adapter protein RapZ
MDAMKLILITGMSGSGKGVALRALEDVGFEAIDNLPISLIEDVLDKRQYTNIAVDIDIRSREFSPAMFLHVLSHLRTKEGYEVITLYLDCDDDVLRKRYTETRRPHPLAADRPVLDGIRLERSLIEAIKSHVDFMVDTSETSVHDLRRLITGHFAGDQGKLNLHITSFSFRHGVPREADLVFDVRFLKNPHYVEGLREKTGHDAEVGAYIQQDPDFSGFFNNLCGLIAPLLPRYHEEGKRYLTIAIGCTGGRHRSVFVAEELGVFLRNKNYDVLVRHRETPEQK